MIEIQNLKKSFGSNLVWEGVDLTIHDGTTVAIGREVWLREVGFAEAP